MASYNTYADRVKETTTTTGTGSLTLAGAATNFQTFNAAFGTTIRFHYSIIDDTNNVWENGIGYLSDSTTLVREEIKSNSSGTTSALTLSAGTKDVICAPVGSGLSGTAVAPSNAFYTCAGLKSFTTKERILVQHRMYLVPFELRVPTAFDGMRARVSTSQTGVGSLGVYQMTTADSGVLIAEGSSTFDTSTTGSKDVSFTAVTLQPGWYWLAINTTAASGLGVDGMDDTEMHETVLGRGGTVGSTVTVCTINRGDGTLPASFTGANDNHGQDIAHLRIQTV